MRSSLDAVAVARDVASSSPSKNTSALDMMRYQRISPDVLPLANGSSGSGSASGASRKPAAQEPTSSTDVHDTPAADSSRLASYLATVSLDQHKPRPRALLPTPVSSSAAGVVIRSPARDHGHQPSGFTLYAAQTPTGGIGIGSSSAAADGSVRLQWGHNKRSRGRRDAPVPASPAPVANPETPAQARRRASVKIQLQRHAAAAAAPAEKLMPPPSVARGGANLRVGPSLPPRPAALAAADALHGRVAIALAQHRSAEEPRAEQQQQQPHPSPARQQQRPHRQATEKEKGKAPAIPESPPRRQQAPQQPAAEVKKLAGRPEVPRIFTTLSRREKEEDFLAMKGTKLPQRPKKRTKAVEKIISTICPGQWLSDVTRSRYMVREKKSKKNLPKELEGDQSIATPDAMEWGSHSDRSAILMTK